LTAFACSDYFLTPSRLSLQDYVQHFGVNPQKSIIIPNGVRVPRLCLDKVLAQREKTWESPQIAWVGRVSLEKRLDFILRSFEIFHRQIPSSRLIIVGDGPYRQEAEQYARQLGLDNHIKWLGYQNNVTPFLMKSHIFIHACLSEEFGYTLAESLAVGLPVVAYDCPHGPGEILDGGRYGILVKTEEEMAEAMKELCRNINFWREMSHRAYTRAQDFDIEKISRKYQEVFRAMLK